MIESDLLGFSAKVYYASEFNTTAIGLVFPVQHYGHA